jgi:hypothetical protein
LTLVDLTMAAAPEAAGDDCRSPFEGLAEFNAIE